MILHIEVAQPVLEAFASPHGWIGFSLGILGREILKRTTRLVHTVRKQLK